MGSFLEVQTSQNSSGGFGIIVLDEFYTGEELLKVVEVVAFFEISPVISIDGGFDEEDVGDTLWCYFKFHVFSSRGETVSHFDRLSMTQKGFAGKLNFI